LRARRTSGPSGKGFRMSLQRGIDEAAGGFVVEGLNGGSTARDGLTTQPVRPPLSRGWPFCRDHRRSAAVAGVAGPVRLELIGPLR
jgi:hypothetical protein